MTTIKFNWDIEPQTLAVSQGAASDGGAVTPDEKATLVDASTSAPRIWATRAMQPEPGFPAYRFGACWNSATRNPTVPGRRFAFGTTQDVSGNRFWSYGLPSGDTIMSVEPWVGGRAMFYGIDNGVFNYRGSKAIVGGAARPVATVTGSTGYVTGTAYQYTFPTWSRPKTQYGATLENSDIWFGVAAIDLTGNQVSDITWTSLPVDMGDQSGAAGTTTANAGTISGSFDENGVPTAPASITATPLAANSRTFDLSWDAAAGADGYRVYYSWQDPTTLPNAPYLECASGGAALRNGDIVIVDTGDLLTADYRWVSGRTHNTGESDRYFPPSGVMNQNPINKPGLGYTWQRIAHGAKPFADSGTHFERVSVVPATMLSSGVFNATRMYLNLSYYWASHDQSFYYIPQQGDPISLRIRLKASQNVTLYVSLIGRSGVASVESTEGEQTLNVTTSWQTFTLSDVFAASAPTGMGVGHWTLHFKNADISTPFAVDCDLCEFRFPRDDRAPFLPTAALAATPAGSDARDHGSVKTYPNWCGMTQLLDVPGRAHRGQLSAQMFDRKTAGAKCHVQFDCIAFDDQEILDWVKYMADPNDARRIAQGQTIPWTKHFGKITFEPMNEAWNNIGEFWTFPSATDGVTAGLVSAGYCYGGYCRWLWELIKTSPYYVAGEWEMMLGGWRGNVASWNANVLAGFLQGDDPATLDAYITAAGYNGGWEVTQAIMQRTDSSYQSVLAATDVSLKSGAVNLLSNRETYPNVRTGIYEGGPGYQLNGLNGANVSTEQTIQQETVGNSMAMCSAALDAFCSGIVNGGYSKQNYFIAVYANQWGLLKDPYWGGDLKPHVRPHIALHNWLGDYRIHVPRGAVNSLFTVADSAGVPGSVDEVSCYLLRSENNTGRAAIVAVNRSITDSKVITVKTPFRQLTGATLIADPGDFRRYERYEAGSCWFANKPLVDGASQTGTRIDVDRWTKAPEVGKTMTIAGVTGTYTVSAVEGFDPSTGYLALSGNLASSPADGAAITVVSGTARGTMTVKGGGQTGASLYVQGGTLSVGGQFTIAGVSGTYTVNAQRHFVATSGRVTFTGALASSPADNAEIDYQDANFATRRWADPLSVDFDFEPSAVGTINNADTITLDDAVGLPSTGLPPGNFAALMFNGVE